MNRTMLKSFVPAAAIGVLLLGGLSGCSGAGSAGGDTAASAGGDRAQALKFAQCMREHGVDMPDPNSGRTGAGDEASSGSEGAMEVGGDPGQGNEAFKACRQYLPNGGQPQKLSAEEMAQQVKYAKCMREHGVDFADPAEGGAPQAAETDMGDKDALKKLADAGRACEVAK